MSQPFAEQQRIRLLDLKDTLIDSINGIGQDQLRSPENAETSGFGQHTADAGSDAYDRDFALSSLSRQSGAVQEIENAIKRIDNGTYGICEACGKPIPKMRLEALPFTRLTVDCQSAVEKGARLRGIPQPTQTLFNESDAEESDDESELAADRA